MKSMTGFAKHGFFICDIEFDLEIKSYNSKNLEIVQKLPGYMSHHETQIKGIVCQYVNRGKVYLCLDSLNKSEKETLLDETGLFQGIQILKKINDSIGHGEDGKIRLEDILKLKFIFKETYREISDNDLNEHFYKNLHEAMEKFNSSRIIEGDSLKEDINLRLHNIRKILDNIKDIDKKNDYYNNLKNKIIERFMILVKENGISENLSEGRLEQEIIYYVLKNDIKEEIVRAYSHLESLHSYVNLDKPVGKALAFILQEMLREANTICSKTGHISIKNSAIELKIETERIKEQVYNIE